jgi:hypothetical protein
VPEIQVLDGAVNIPDGSGTLSFGSTSVGRAIVKTLTVKNTGTGILTLSEPIAVPAGFSLVSSFDTTSLGPGKTTTFIVQLNADATGTYSGTIEFSNDDGDENPFNFTILGSVNQEVFLPIVLR